MIEEIDINYFKLFVGILALIFSLIIIIGSIIHKKELYNNTKINYIIKLFCAILLLPLSLISIYYSLFPISACGGDCYVEDDSVFEKVQVKENKN